MSTNIPKRGRPPVDSDLVRFRAERRVLDAIDAFAADQAPPASRSDAVRTLVSQQLISVGLLVDPAAAAVPIAMSESDMIASAGEVRSQAAAAADAAMSGMDATKQEKAARRGALTDEPAVVGKARAKAR